MLKTDSIIIKIANFYIKLNFHETEHAYLKNKFQIEIINYLKNFLVNNKDLNISYEINFIWDVSPKILSHNGNEIYIKLYSKSNNSKINFYYQSSLTHFEIFLKSILIELLQNNQGFLVHGASIYNASNNAIVFLGKSGDGKSTITEILSQKIYYNEWKKFTDDILIIRNIDNIPYVFQTPFFEKNINEEKTILPMKLSRIYILKKSKNCTLISNIKKEDRYGLSLSSFSIGYNKKIYLKIIKNINIFIRDFKEFYLLRFTLNFDDIKKIDLISTAASTTTTTAS